MSFEIPRNHDVLVRLAEDRIQEIQKVTQAEHLLRELKGDQPGWLSQQAGRLLYQVGAQLVELGERLEGCEPPTLVLEKR
jgi:hypothetical protein